MASGDTAAGVLIGLHDTGTESHFEWIDDTEVSFTNSLTILRVLFYICLYLILNPA